MTALAAVADPVRTIVRLTNAVAASRAVQVIAELAVADAIGPDEEVAIGVLAQRAGCHPDALHRVLRLLETHGVFRSEQDCWSHTPTSVVLRSDHATSARAYARMIGQPSSWERMTQLSTSVRTGRPAPVFDETGGTFDYLAKHPDEAGVFDEAMTAKAHADIAAVLAAVDFSTYTTIADIGGGRGHLLRAITAHHTDTRGILFDLPNVVDHVDPEETDRIVCHPGDFFIDQLPSADLSILMQVIHDWDDDVIATRQIIGPISVIEARRR